MTSKYTGPENQRMCATVKFDGLDRKVWILGNNLKNLSKRSADEPDLLVQPFRDFEKPTPGAAFKSPIPQSFPFSA